MPLTYNFTPMKKLISYFFILCSVALFGQGTITTSPPLTPNNGQSGITFNVSSSSPVDIDGISNIFSTGATTASVWVRIGGAQGPPNISTANGWVEVIVGATLTGADNTSLIPIPFGGNSISIPANTPVGIHIAGNTRYQTGTSADQVIYTDGTFTVNVSDSVAYGGGLPSPTFNPRRFLGSVTYSLGLGGGCTPPFSNFQIDSIKQDSARITWTPGNINNTFKLEYGPSGFTPGNGVSFQASYFGGPPSVFIEPLIPDTDYDVYLTEYCTNDSVYFAAPQTFRTLPICPAPSNIQIIALDSNSVTFTYTATTDSLSWEWGPTGFIQGTGTTGTSVGDTITIGGLSPNTGYDLALISDCSDRGDSTSRVSRLGFTTDCGYASARWVENFDGTAFPCLRAYTDVSVGTPTVTITTAFNPTSGTQQLLLNNSSATGPTQDILLIFQPFYGMGSLNKMVEFNAKTASTTPTTVEVVSIPDPDNPGVYNLIQSFTLNTSNQKFTVNLDAASNYNGTDPVIALRHGAQNTFQAIYVDDFVFDVIPTCPPIDPFTAEVNAVGTDVYLNWISSSNAQGANVSWGNPGFSPNAGLGTITTIDTFAVVSGLTANTIYEFYIQDSCAANDEAVWVGPFSVLTGCVALSPVSLPMFDGFELYTGPTFSGTTNLCNSTHSWRFDASDESSSRMRLQAGANYLKNGLQAATLDHSPTAPAVQTNYLTLTVNLSSYTSSGGIQLGFYIMSHGQEASPDNRVWVRGAPSDPWIEAVNLDALRSAQGIYDSIQGLDIKGIINGAGQTVGAATQIRFGQSGRFGSFNTTFSDGITIDDVSLEAVSCPIPPGLNVSGVFDTTATLNWAGSASQYQYWFGPGGFYQGTTTTAGTKHFINANSVVLDTLNPQNCYQFLVRSICAAGDTSAWGGPFDFCTPCSPISAPSTEDWNALLSGKDLGCFSAIQDPSHLTSNFLGASITAAGSPFSPSRQVEMDNSNSSHPLMIVSPPTTDMTLGDKRVVVRARMLTNYVPEINMLVGSMSNPNDPNTFHPLDTFQLTNAIPHDRFVCNLNTANGYNGSDQYFAIAHGNGNTFRTFYIDDVIYEVIPSCPEVSQLGILAVDSMNATLSFVPDNGSAGNFQIEYGSGSLGSALNSQMLVSNDTFNLTGLTANTNYCFWVREICSASDTSNWTGPFCFKTQCMAIQAPYLENWDNLSSASKDLGCFGSIEGASLQGSNFLGVTIQASTFYAPPTSPNYVEFDNSSNVSDPLMLTSPRTIDMTLGDKRLRFNMREASTFNTAQMIVGTMSNPVDASTFNPLDTINPDDTWQEYTVNLDATNGYNGSDEYFAFAHDLGGTFDYIFIDELRYEVIPTCVRPNTVTVGALTQSTAGVSWLNANGNLSPNYEVEYGTGPLGSTSNTRISHSSNSISLSGLTAGTGYCIWIREICSAGDTSFWQGPTCFATPCPTSYSAPYSTNFEGISIGIASGTPAGWENCWTHVQGPGTVRWESEDASGANENSFGTGPFLDNSLAPAPGGTYMYLETSSSGGPAELISPGIDIGTVTNPELEYYYHMHGATMNKLVVYAENSAGTRTAIDSIIGQQQVAQADPFLRRNVSLGSLPTGVYNFVFEGHRGTSFTGDISIDDVSVQQGSSCPSPLSLSGDPISQTSAIARWGGTSQANSYQVEYGPTGFSPGSGTLSITAVDSITLTFASANNLCQDVYVRAICSAGDTSNWVGPTAVCPEEVTCDSLDQYNSSLEIYDQSALFVPWAGAAGDVEIATTQSSSSPNSVRIHDAGTNSFSDLVALFDTLSSGAWEVSFDMYVPTGKGAYFNIQQNYIGGAAGNLWGGEVYFLDNGSADAVYTTGSTLAGTFNYTQNTWFTMSTVIDLDNDSIWFEINGSSTNVGYTYSAANAGGPIQFNGVNFFSGVRQGLTYSCDYYFDNFCINPRTIATNCPDPSGLAATSNVGCDSVELDWTSQSGSSLLEYGPAGFAPGTGSSVNVSSTPYVVTGLNPGTSYDFLVSDICGSDTSNTISTNETTASGPLPVASFATSHMFVGNTVELYVDASASTGATSYSWDFGNGTSGAGMLDTNTYIGGGTYTVTLVVTNGCGSDTAVQTVSFSSLDESLLAQTINAYPNPSEESLWVEADLDGSQTISIRLIDGQGRSVYAIHEEGHNGHLKTQLDVSNLAAGMYMLEIRQGMHRASRRISIK